MKHDEPPRLTLEQIEEALKRGARNAEELRKALEQEHLRNYSRSMSLRLD